MIKNPIMIRSLLASVFLFFIMIGCGGSPCKDVPTCTQVTRNHFIYSVLKDSYLWADTVGEFNTSLAQESDAVFLNHYRHPRDRFSFVLDNRVYQEHFVEGKNQDFGFLTQIVHDEYNVSSIRVKSVSPNSAAALLGITRSDILLSLHENNESNKSDAYTLSFKKQNGVIQNKEIIAKSYKNVNVRHVKILEQNGSKIGYFVLGSFVGPDLIKNMDKTFAYFKDHNITDLILDLRYNGGGYLSASAHLGTLIAGDKVAGKVFERQIYNTRYSHLNTNTHFAKKQKNALQLSRLYVLMTGGSASASESLINALQAPSLGFDVVTIGTRSYGKPFGMHAISYCDKVIFPIQFFGENSDGVSDYEKGLEPTCQIQEKLLHDFGDTQESLLKEALYYQQYHHCSPKANQ